jgi:hypothetical protein
MIKQGRPKLENEVQNLTKFERRYEDDETITIWKYDLDRSNGPVEVNITYKNNIDKNWEKRAKQAKDDRRTERQMKKINEKTTSNKTGKRGRPKKNK